MLSWIAGVAGSRSSSTSFQPADDRIAVAELSPPSDYEEFIRQWGRLLASRPQLRSAGWKGSADLDGLIAFGQSLNGRNRRRLLTAASRAAAEQRGAWAKFRASGLGKAKRRA